jgi:RNA polymerase sigma-70 factor (ECF subfamily)
MEDFEVIKRVKNGDIEAFSMLVEKYHKHLLNFIFNLVRDENIVEDIGQEVFLNIYKSLKDFDENRGTPFSAWLFTSARNRCISELRNRQSRERVSITDIINLRSKDRTAEETLMEKERWQAIRISLEQLPEPFRNSILMSLNGSSIEEMAKAGGISPGTAKSRLFRAREKMKSLVKEYYGGKGYEII